MTTLQLVLDEMISDTPGGTARYTEELARALIENAPTGCVVRGIVAASPEPDYERIAARLPGLDGLFKSALARRELRAAWQHGFTPVPHGMVHAPSLLAPLRKHDRVNSGGNQIVVTIHDVAAWTNPALLSSQRVGWVKAMAGRAFRYADAVVVPTHSVANQLESILDFGDRVRVIGGAVSSRLREPADAEDRARRLALPDRYLLAIGRVGPRHGLDSLLAALAIPGTTDVPLLIVGSTAEAASNAAEAAGLGAGRAIGLGHLSDAELAVALSRATVFVYPTSADGFGMPLLEAFHFGTPVVHSDAESLMEIADGAGLAVPASDEAAYPALLAEAIDRVLTDDELAARLSILGADRAAFFSWRASAEKVWQLHADL
jgi:glycosyltransferase involved in cell wall biosynthesis